MKFIIFVLGFALYLTSSLTSAIHHHRLRVPDEHPFPIPDEIDGYTAYSPEQARDVKSVLSPFISYSITFVIDAVMSHKLPPENHSCFMRRAFRKSVEGGYEIIYYYRAYNPHNKEGNVYYGTFTVFEPTEQGLHAKLLGFTIDAHAPRAEIYKA